MKPVRFFALFFLIFGVFALPALAEVPVVGENIPHSLKAKDSEGQSKSFESVKGENGAVLIFLRSADWCPYCQAQLLNLAQEGSQIEDLGYHIVIISYDTVPVLKNFKSKYTFPYTMLSDEGSEIIKAFGVLNTDIPEGSTYYGIPHPTIFVVDASGVVQGVLTEEGYKSRPDMSKIVAAIKGDAP